VQVEQHLVLGEQRAEPIGDVVLVLARQRRRRELAIEVAVAGASMLGVGERIGDRHQRHPAGDELQRAGVDVAQDALNRARAAGLVAVDSAEDDEARTGPRRRAGDRLEGTHAGTLVRS
jgi:hypothetical protein